MTTALRRARDEDLTDLVRLRVAMLAENRGLESSAIDDDFRGRTRASLAGELRAARLTAWVAEAGGTSVGSVSLLTSDVGPLPEDPRRLVGLVKDLYVVPDARGRGVGRALVQVCIDDAKRRGIRRLHLSATPMARGLYESIGFSSASGVLDLHLAEV